MAILGWRATKFMMRLGFALALRGAQRGVERVRQRDSGDVKNETIEGEYHEAPETFIDTGNSNLPTRDWRVWSTQPDADTKTTGEPLSWGKKKES